MRRAVVRLDEEGIVRIHGKGAQAHPTGVLVLQRIAAKPLSLATSFSSPTGESIVLYE